MPAWTMAPGNVTILKQPLVATVPNRNTMKHPTSRLLHAYWDRLRGERAAPERSEIEPGEIRGLLADSMILEVDAPVRAARVRLAGTRICALYGRELKGSAFADLWGAGEGAAPGREPRDMTAWELVDTVAGDTSGVVSGLTGFTERGETVELELLLLPLRHCGKTQARMLGALSPAVIPSWLGHRPIVTLETKSQRVLGRAAAEGRAAGPGAPDLPVPANDPLPMRRGHLLVHKGGLA